MHMLSRVLYSPWEGTVSDFREASSMVVIAQSHNWVKGSQLGQRFLEPKARFSGYQWVHGSTNLESKRAKVTLAQRVSTLSSHQLLIPGKEPLAVGPGLACGHERAGRFMVPRSPCSWDHWAQNSSTAQTSSGHAYYCCPMKFYAPSPQV